MMIVFQEAGDANEGEKVKRRWLGRSEVRVTVYHVACQKTRVSSYRVVGQIFCTILNKNQLRLIVCSIISCMVIVVNAVSIDLSRPIYYTRLRKLD